MILLLVHNESIYNVTHLAVYSTSTAKRFAKKQYLYTYISENFNVILIFFSYPKLVEVYIKCFFFLFQISNTGEAGTW